MLESDPTAWVSGEPGIDNEGVAYIASLRRRSLYGLTQPDAVGADAWGLEPIPAPEGDKVFYGHAILLQRHGIYIFLKP